MFDKLFCCTTCADDADETGMDLMTAEKAEEARQRFLETISAHKIPYEGITVTNLEVREVPEEGGAGADGAAAAAPGGTYRYETFDLQVEEDVHAPVTVLSYLPPPAAAAAEEEGKAADADEDADAAAAADKAPKPALLVLHATGSSTAALDGRLRQLARRGLRAVGVDARYHGRRLQEGADPKEPYLDALVQAFIAGGEHPFLYDNVYDLLKVMDYLVAREDVDAARIGATGVSLGGMHAWLLAFADPRVACCAPAIGVQWFDWAVRHDKWQGRVDSIKPVFEVAAAQEGKAAVDGAAVRAVWERLVPGLCEAFDAPRSLAALAPRPLLALQGAKDLRCPIEGVREAWVGVRRAYAAYGKEAADRCELHVERGAGHEVTPAMWRRAEEFFDEHLLGPPPPAAAAAVAEGDAMASSASRL